MQYLDFSAYIMYRIAEGFIDRCGEAIHGLKRRRVESKKIVMLAAEIMAGLEHSIYIHSGIHDLTENEICDVVGLVGRILISSHS